VSLAQARAWGKKVPGGSGASFLLRHVISSIPLHTRANTMHFAQSHDETASPPPHALHRRALHCRPAPGSALWHASVGHVDRKSSPAPSVCLAGPLADEMNGA
jgi:hypothetical protein